MTSTKSPADRPDDSGGVKPLRADARRNRERIIAVAEAVFAEKGPSASTEEVAAGAGVAIGTVFKHFPTKQALLQAIMKGLLERLNEQLSALAAGDRPGEGLFTFVTEMVDQAARKRTVVTLLAETGVDLQVAGSLQSLREGVEALLDRARRAGTVREDVRLDEVLALLTGLCHGALHAGWDVDLQRRTLAIVFEGLRGQPDAAARSRGSIR
ncbi:TetR/AcrR family transcriptional regulator [Streptosporangium sp. NPDC023615]|uniref:TetR/AcrR family transcriptional regulator n=1 Tax=Streptosporangium sp. NPDC023615 TaxID=3154794 RepID=UPI0034199C50